MLGTYLLCGVINVALPFEIFHSYADTRSDQQFSPIDEVRLLKLEFSFIVSQSHICISQS